MAGGPTALLETLALAARARSAAAPGNAAQGALQALVLRTVKNPNTVADMAYASRPRGTRSPCTPPRRTNQQWEVVPVQATGSSCGTRRPAPAWSTATSVENGHKRSGYGYNSGYEDQFGPWSASETTSSRRSTVHARHGPDLNGTTNQLTQWQCH
ncbi:hypothetical protein, partial [Streptomyces somaliensis]|uniref:hypothetical protein n=1 Tax=Streptomyces somaliensis TaxID=78355 RepID=UPI0034E96C08|nr:hypothetical protein [Streptomyces somaliensis]